MTVVDTAAEGSPGSPADREIELKFHFGPGSIGAVRAALGQYEGVTRQRALVSTYHDDADHSLRAAGLTLRVREDGGRYTQTIKGEGDGGFSRGEWECPLFRAGPDLAAAARTPAAEALAAAGPLAPLFTSRIQREARRLVFDGAHIEAAIDLGAVEAAGGLSAPIAQLELELLDGPPRALFALAAKLSAVAPLRLTFETKSQVGFALLTPPIEAARIAPPVLDPRMTAGEAFQAVARAALRQILANEPLVRAGPAPEAVHQMRIGLRRLRAALKAFKPVVEDGQLEAIKGRLRWLSDQLGPSRDLEVFAAESLAPTLDALGPDPALSALAKRLSARQAAARADLDKALGDATGREVALAVATWIETGDWTAQTAAQAPARAFAEHTLARLHRQLIRRGKGLKRLEPAQRHQVRVAAKTLRYGLEAFGGLLPEDRAREMTRRLGRLQDALGQLNDIETARRPLPLLGKAPSAEALFAAGVVAGHRLAQKPRVLKSASRRFKRLREARRPWG